MKNIQPEYEKWIAFANSNLTIAKAGKKISKSVSFEDLCFNAQQAAEKAIKAYLIFLKKKYPRTHNIQELLGLLEEVNITIPAVIIKAKSLTNYVTTRYPGDADTISTKEYKEAVKTAEAVFNWVKKNTDTKDKLF